MILIYVTFANLKEAKKAGKMLLEKKLCACVNIIKQMRCMYFWPKNSKNIQEDKEVILLIKTLSKNFQKIEKIIEENHCYEIPCIFSLPIDKVSQKYLTWLKENIN